MKRALVIGSGGTIGGSLSKLLRQKHQVLTISRQNSGIAPDFNSEYCDSSLANISEEIKQEGSLDLIICCVGVLHNELLLPEKRLAQLSGQKLVEYFKINTIIPALCLKEFAPLLHRKNNSQFVFLSAMVGSITDNALGGWYGYRSSKAALNMMVKTASIELARTHKTTCLAVIHPGTTRGPLSRPFAGGVSSDKYYSPEQSAKRILSVAESLTPELSGSFINWDGNQIPW